MAKTPTSYGQVEAVNKKIKNNLKKKLTDLKGTLADELSIVLWSYQITSQITIGETPFP